MQNKFASFFLLALVISCKNITPSSGKPTLPFDSKAYSVNTFAPGSSKLRHKLLHAIYLAKKEQVANEADKISDSDFEEIKDDSIFNKNFCKLIISRPDREELVYIPEGVNKADLLNVLNLKLENNMFWVWKSEFKKREVAYLIETSPAEVLENEKLFTKNTTIELNEIYPYQMIEVSLQVYLVAPSFNIQSSASKDPRCRDIENPEICYCNYSRQMPAGTLAPALVTNRANIEGVLTLDQTKQNIIFNLATNTYQWRMNADNQQADKKLFSLNFPQSENFEFVSRPNNCQSRVKDQVFTLQNQFQYKMEFNVYGASETLDSFGNLPGQI